MKSSCRVPWYGTISRIPWLHYEWNYNDKKKLEASEKAVPAVSCCAIKLSVLDLPKPSRNRAGQAVRRYSRDGFN